MIEYKKLIIYFKNDVYKNNWGKKKRIMKRDLTKGNVTVTMLLFAVPMILGNILQQCYNLADTWIVGWFVGSDALAAVGSAYTLMTFLTSLILGMCMGSGALFSICYGKGDIRKFKEYITSNLCCRSCKLYNPEIYYKIVK